jgi:2-keto-4-pentenoate hydratase/2-oxohepta-3-ene-1,7-dioic acid hydratase in catechol pathway
MKLLRYGMPGSEKPGCLDVHGQIRDLSDLIPDIGGDILSSEGLNYLRGLEVESLPLVSNASRIGPCVARVGKFICIGLNYADHALEANMKPQSEPIVFMKATSSICGANDPLIIPKGSTQTDWEVELGIVIGRAAKRVSEADALNYVAGYCLINDVSERFLQLKGTGQWTKGKSCDSFGPIGPWLVTTDEIKDPHQLSIWLEVDGKRYQDSHTSQMIFSISHIVSYLSQFFTLHPGDVITTGTPAGVGLGQKPEPVYLKAGQTVRLGISGLGEQKHLTVDEG